MSGSSEPERGIEVRGAQVRTATVQIKALTVSGKWLTLAVFRQLPWSRGVLMTFDPAVGYGTARAVGTPWGRVNYHPRACPRRAHLYLVLEANGRLYQLSWSGDGWSPWWKEYAPKDRAEAERAKAGMQESWTDCYLDLCALDQLFVAV
jgi:hypothetical protein